MTTGEPVPIPEFGTRQAGIDYIARPGVYALIENSDGQIAVIETSQGYFLPGGGIHPGESDADALQRELLEETGYQVSGLLTMGETIEYIHAEREQTYYQIHSRFYKVQPGPRVGAGMETDQHLVWLRPAEAVKRLKRPGQAWAVQNMVQR